MEFSTGPQGREEDIIRLFTSTFAATEGVEEGALIGNLVRELLAGTASDDIFVFTTEEECTIVAAIVFSRLTYAQDDRTVFVLAPVIYGTVITLVLFLAGVSTTRSIPSSQAIKQTGNSPLCGRATAMAMILA